ncbi:hypothetical protein J6590_062762 [Homalodisca vitripennis]|nr:hypothetical protein J6590_062762 [Homalodisca vitripennis]
MYHKLQFLLDNVYRPSHRERERVRERKRERYQRVAGYRPGRPVMSVSTHVVNVCRVNVPTWLLVTTVAVPSRAVCPSLEQLLYWSTKDTRTVDKSLGRQSPALSPRQKAPDCFTSLINRHDVINHARCLLQPTAYGGSSRPHHIAAWTNGTDCLTHPRQPPRRDVDKWNGPLNSSSATTKTQRGQTERTTQLILGNRLQSVRRNDRFQPHHRGKTIDSVGREIKRASDVHVYNRCQTVTQPRSPTHGPHCETRR